MPPPLLTKAGAEGVFVVVCGTLTKYEAGTLKQAGTLQLAEPPTDQGNMGDQQRPPMPPPALGMVLAANGGAEKVIVLLGDQLFIVDAASLKLDVNVTLPKLPAPPDPGASDQGNAGQMRPPMPPGPHQPSMIEVNGHIAYVQRGPQIVAVSITDGSIRGQAKLPKPPR